MSIILEVMRLDPGERSRIIDKLASREYEIPYSKRRTISRRTIYRWLEEYNESPDKGDALLTKKRSDRGTFRSLTEEEKTALSSWRIRNPYHTAEDLWEELMKNQATARENPPTAQTIARYLRSIGLDRETLLRERKAEEAEEAQKGKTAKEKSIRLAFEAPYPQAIWMADTKGPKVQLKNPKSPEGASDGKLIVFVDTYSRFVTGARYFIEENAENVMALFKTAMATYGVPEILYVDRGSPYIAKALTRAAALLGCQVMFTPPRDPESKGLVEKIMPNFSNRLESELRLLDGPLDPEVGNEYLAAYVSQDYHQKVHSVTGEKPVDRYAAFPEQYRRFVSEKTLSMIFLPCQDATVTKTCLIRFHKHQYLVPDPSLCRRKVEVRYDPLDASKLLVFFKDEFRGMATLYDPVTNYLERQAVLEKMQTAPARNLPSPPPQGWPAYTYLERKLASYRREIEKNREINEEMAELKAQKEMVRATLTAQPKVGKPRPYSVFALEECTHLLCMLLRRQLAPHERLAVAALWRSYGPVEEPIVRQTVGRLLGEQVPDSDLAAYLDAIRIAVCTVKSSKKEGGQKNDQ